MKSSIICLIFFCLLTLTSIGKEKKVKFGKIDADLLEMTTYEPDSSAAAVVLYDKGDAAIEFVRSEGWELHNTRHVRIKILKKEGLDQANFKISLYTSGGNGEELSGLKAVTYNMEDGKVVMTKFERKDLIHESINKYWNSENFTLPNVKVGSVIEVKYMINSRGYFRNMRNWYFQKDIPVAYSEYDVSIPEYFHFRKFTKGFERIADYTEEDVSGRISDTEKSKNALTGQTQLRTANIDFRIKRYHWVAKAMPAFEEEAYLSTSDNYIQQVGFELQSVKFPQSKLYNYSESWKSINEKLYNDSDLGDIVNLPGNFIEEELAVAVNGQEGELAKAHAIFEYVRNHMKWNGMRAKYTTGIRKAWKDKTGNCADINLVLTLMLKKAGINAMPVVLSTRDNGLFVYPTSTGFNYVIASCIIDGKRLLMDATDKCSAINQLPYRCLNNKGMIVQHPGTEPQWIDLWQVGTSIKSTRAQLSLNEDGSLTGSCKITRKGYSAMGKRASILSYKDIDEYKEKYTADFQDWEFDKFDVENVGQTAMPLNESFDINMSDVAVSSGDRIYIKTTLFDQKEKNPFKLKERKYPVDFGYTFKENQVYLINIPEGYEVEELPQAINMKIPQNGGAFTLIIRDAGNNMLQIQNRISINKPIFTAEEYEILKEFYNQIIQKESEQIILKKKA
ncbi:DUF3857 domain-containing protein [Puteibacter caeruleilacunae]|nr:DUF3857 domain-containing protein [Puteibacter caeruleilacunae]